MKTLITLMIAIAATQANASWFQEICGNAEGTVRLAMGHDDNEFFVTKRVWGDQGRKDETISLDLRNEATYEFVDENEILNEYSDTCEKEPDATTGIAFGHRVASAKIVITKKDGSVFDEKILGVSQDLKSVEAHLICERHMNSMIPCR